MKKGWIALLSMVLVGAGADGMGSASAADGTPLDLAVRYGRYHTTTVVNADGTAVETHEWSKTVLKESALDNSKRASVGYSTSAQQGEVLAAYTVKADGRRIDVPKNNYQLEVNSGQAEGTPVYSDWTTLTVVFPDVAVGDSVVLSYKVTHKEPMFVGHFSAAQLFYRTIAYDDIRVRFDYPATMWAQHEGRGMKEMHATEGERRIVEWTWSNPRPVKSDRRDFSVFDPDKEVGYAFSTFRNYADIASAYGVRAQPRAAVTDRLVKLAADIVTSAAGKKEQARALYEWVATNITYAGNCIGIGAVVPRNLDFVLDNKMGDCKDHATLLQALLTARGIKSTQALVNAGSVYGLPRIPVAMSVNHVINYLPEFDLFADSTSESTPFGLLPLGDQGKPVLLTEAHREGLKTPVPPSSSNRQTIRSVLKLAADGSVTGSVEVAQAGENAVSTREWARNLSKDAEDDFVKDVFRRMGLIGSGRFEKDDPKRLLDVYRYRADFKAEKFFKTPGAGAFYIVPPLNIAMPIYSAAQSMMESEADADVTCTGGTLVEDYTIELPKTIKVLAVPSDLKVGNERVSYQATYKLRGKTLSVRRVLEDRTEGRVCSPKSVMEFNKVAEKVIDNLKEPVLYR